MKIFERERKDLIKYYSIPRVKIANKNTNWTKKEIVIQLNKLDEEYYLPIIDFEISKYMKKLFYDHLINWVIFKYIKARSQYDQIQNADIRTVQDEQRINSENDRLEKEIY